MEFNKGAYKIGRLQGADAGALRQLITLFSEVFEEPLQAEVSDFYLAKLLKKHEFIAITAMADNQVVGGLTAYVLPQYTGEHSEVYIYDIAVKKKLQRTGIGKMLIYFLADHCKENTIKLMFVEAHETDAHAVDFYRSIGGQAEKVAHFNFSLHK